MTYLQRTAYFITLCIIGVFVLGGAPLAAQGPGENVAVTYSVQETGVEPGDIIAQDETTNNLRTSRIPNSMEMFGVVARRPLIVFQTSENTIPIIRSGQTVVNVHLGGGDISIGDTITSSYVRGYGRKASETDVYKLGRALEPLDASSATGTVIVGESEGEEVASGQILVDVFIGAIGPGIDDSRVQGSPSNAAEVVRAFEPVSIAKYLVAAFVAIAAIYSSFRYFGKNLSAGVSSIGRNPMAKDSIKRMLIMNVTAIVLVSLGGVALGVIILLLPVA